MMSDASKSRMPVRIWADIRGGGISLPGGQHYIAGAWEDRKRDRGTEYVRADLVTDALRRAEMILCRVPDITTNDGGKGPGTTTRGALEAVRAVIARDTSPFHDAEGRN